MSNFYTHLGVLDQTWLDCREIVVYGLGVMALKSMESLRRDFEIPFIIDNDPKKAGTHYAGIPILTLEQAREKLPGKKIVIASTYGVSRAIAKTLDAIGFLRAGSIRRGMVLAQPARGTPCRGAHDDYGAVHV